MGIHTPAGYELDERDQAILASRTEQLGADPEPRVGDYVNFADGITRRISYIWRDDSDPSWGSVQTSDGGSYYLGAGYVSMSGSLYTGVKPETLTLTDEERLGSVWFFHHDWQTAGGGVDTAIMFRVYECSEDATR